MQHESAVIWKLERPKSALPNSCFWTWDHSTNWCLDDPGMQTGGCYKSSKSGATADKAAGGKGPVSDGGRRVENPYNANAKWPLSRADNGRLEKRAKGLEPSTASLEG